MSTLFDRWEQAADELDEGAVDLFAGWSVDWTLRADLGLDVLGFEVSTAVCRIREHLGMRTRRVDLGEWPTPTGRVRRLWASPPCQDWSAAGPKTGRAGRTGWLVDVPLRWALALRPEWIVFEQVPAALPVWESHAFELCQAGYHAWTGVLDAASFGTPQHRRRAILMARRTGPVRPPAATHGPAEHLEAYVTMGAALAPLGFPSGAVVHENQGAGAVERNGGPAAPPRYADERPAPTVTTDPGRHVIGVGPGAASWGWWRLNTGRDWKAGEDRAAAQQRELDRPAPALTRKAGGQWRLESGPPDAQGYAEVVYLTVPQLLVLMGYPPDVPLAARNVSEAREAIGNGVPRQMVAAIARALESAR